MTSSVHSPKRPGRYAHKRVTIPCNSPLTPRTLGLNIGCMSPQTPGGLGCISPLTPAMTALSPLNAVIIYPADITPHGAFTRGLKCRSPLTPMTPVLTAMTPHTPKTPRTPRTAKDPAVRRNSVPVPNTKTLETLNKMRRPSSRRFSWISKSRRPSLKGLIKSVRTRSRSRGTRKERSRSEGCSQRSSLLITDTDTPAPYPAPADFDKNWSTRCTLNHQIKLTEQTMRALDGQAAASNAKMLLISQQLDRGFADLVQRMERRKAELKQQLQTIALRERKLLNQQKESLQLQLVSYQQAQEEADSQITPQRRYSARRISVSCSVNTGQLSQSLQQFGSTSAEAEVAPDLLLIEQKYVNRANKLHILWKRRQSMPYVNCVGLQSPSCPRRQLLRVICAYLPFTADLPELTNSGLRRRKCDFSATFDIALSAEDAPSVHFKNDTVSRTIMNGPQRHCLIIMRLKYSSNGGAGWSDCSNIQFIRYSPRLELSFDANRSGNCLRFGLDGRSVSCTKHDYLYHTALFGIEATSSMCSVFRIKFKLQSISANRQQCDFAMGFLAGSKLPDYDQALGCGANKDCSTGIRVSDRNMFLHDKEHSKTEIIYPLHFGQGFGVNDMFRWTFNFHKKSWSVFHGNKSVLKMPLESKHIHPGISLGNPGEKLFVVSWQFK